MTVVTTPQTATAWPIPTVGKGKAYNKRDAAARLGLKLSGVEAAIRRTGNGTARIRFPEADGYAFDPANAKRVMVPFWYERTLLPYGKAIGTLDKSGKIIPPVEPATAAAA